LDGHYLRAVRLVSYTLETVVTATAIPVQKRTGRPRSERTEKAILAAASQLLAESGLAALTIEGVAERAGGRPAGRGDVVAAILRATAADLIRVIDT